MARIVLEHIRHRYGGASADESGYALKQLHHAWEDGGAYALLGPSGCGKTTLLNIVSGLLRPSEGRVLFDDRDVTALHPEQRHIAQVFQFPVVYDTLTVRENLAFPLRNRGLPRDEIAARVEDVLEIIGLGAHASRRARGLRADEKQKISLGRGLVRNDVNAILLDEPLTVIDPQLKWELRAQLKALQRRFGHTMIHVTHDQTEALTFADTVVVMHEGRIVQVGTPEELFERPQHRFVGHFIGSPGMNLMPLARDGGVLRLGGHAVSLPDCPTPAPAGTLELGVRPEYVRLGESGLPATLLRVEDTGRLRIVRLRLAGQEIAAVLREGEGLPAEPRISFDPAGMHLYADGWRVATVAA
jgi:glycerol transport system ATP-binding protein